MKNIKWSAIFISFAYISSGVMFFIYPNVTKEQLCLWVGYAGLILGLYNIIAYLVRSKQKSFFKNDFMIGLLLLTIGAIVLLHPDYFIEIIYIILAIAIMLSGYSKLQDVVDSLRLGGKNGLSLLIMALISIGIGIVIVLEGIYMSIHTIDRLIGVGLIYSGGSDFITATLLSIKMIKHEKEKQKQLDKQEEEIEYEIEEKPTEEVVDETIVDDQNNNPEV